MTDYHTRPRVKFTSELWWKWRARGTVTPAVERRRREIAAFRKSLQRPLDAK